MTNRRQGKHGYGRVWRRQVLPTQAVAFSWRRGVLGLAGGVVCGSLLGTTVLGVCGVLVIGLCRLFWGITPATAYSWLAALGSDDGFLWCLRLSLVTGGIIGMWLYGSGRLPLVATAALGLVVTGCTFGMPPDGSPVPLVAADLPAVASSVDLTTLVCPVPTVIQETVHVSLLVPAREPVYQPRVPTKGTPPAAGTSLAPVAVVRQAQQAARVEPTEAGYAGGSGEQTYPWVPGKVFTIYLSKKQGTGIFLPPGETILSGLFLDPEVYEVTKAQAGSGAQAYDALIVHPLVDQGDAQGFLLTSSGRRYLLHFVVGTTGMLAVTFTAPPAPTIAQTPPQPTLILPRPPGDPSGDPTSVGPK